MKKVLLAAGISLLLSVTVSAAEPITLADRADKLDTVVYGSVQSGSLSERVGTMDQDVYGMKKANGLNDEISGLYTDVLHSDNDAKPALETRVNTMEYYLTDRIRQDSLVTRVGDLETKVLGKTGTGALEKRTDALETAVYGDKHFELTDVDLPANTVFKISMNEDVNTKTNLVGDVVHFTVQEDVRSGDVLVLPRGAQGSGVITKVVKPQSFGRSGKLEISFDQVFSIDDEAIPTVLGVESKEMIKKEAAAVGASAVGALVLGPVGLVGGFFVKGSNVDMPAGTQLYIQTKETVHTKGIKLEPGAPGSDAVKPNIGTSAAAAEATAAKTDAGTAAKTDAAAVKTDASAATAKTDTATKTEAASADKGTAGTNADDSASVVIVRNA